MGRSPAKSNLVLSSLEISAAHARVWSDNDTCVWVEDLGSTNGSYYYDPHRGAAPEWIKINGPTVLASGVHFRLGHSAVEFVVAGDSEKAVIEGTVPAPHVSRAVAWVIDYLLVMVVVMRVAHPANYFVLILSLIAYHTLSISLVQQTLGKAVFGLTIARTGKKPGFWWSLGRASVGYFVLTVLGLGVLAAIFNRRHRCVHDYVFGSMVVLRPERRLFARISEFFEGLKEAAQKRFKAVTLVVWFWGFVAESTHILDKAFDFLSHMIKPTLPEPSVAEGLSFKAAATITLTAGAVVSGAVTYVPAVRVAADWLVAPRYHGVQPPAGWVECGCPDRHVGAGALYNGKRYHPDGISCSQTLFK